MFLEGKHKGLYGLISFDTNFNFHTTLNLNFIIPPISQKGKPKPVTLK